MCDGSLFSFPSKQNIYAVEQKRMEVWLQCPEMIIQREPSNIVFSDLRFLPHLLVGGGGGSKGKHEELIHIFDCWIWATWCSAPPVIVQWPFLISASVELQTKFMLKSFIYWVKNSCNLWSIPGLFPNREGGRKRLVVPLLWIIRSILPAWVLSDPFAWPLLGLGRRAGCFPYLC